MKKETKKLFKELFTRIERLEEKVVPTSKTNESSDIFKGTGDTTTTTVQLKNELTELPEKWCVKQNEEVANWVVKKWSYFGPLVDETQTLYYHHANSKSKQHGYHNCVLDGYTEITFDQFKKWVLKEDEKQMIKDVQELSLETTARVMAKYEDKEKPLSIREVQVKVSSQEETNECAEIAKARGEDIWDYTKAIHFSDNGYKYFRISNTDSDFGLFCFWDKLKEISIQEYRERFGKANKFEIPKYITQEEALEFGRKLETKEIDWNKYGEYVESDWEIVMVMKNKSKIEDDFTGVIIKTKEGCDFEKGLYSKTWNKKAFKKCTEPITLSND